MKILINLGEIPSIRQSSRLLALVVRPILEATVQIDQAILQNYKIPPLYQSGVRYREEPRGQGFEDFAIIPQILARGFGDCDDLSPWRVAELRHQGEKAKIRITWKRQPDGQKLFHVQVRRGDGTIEDPSRILGMGV